MFWSKVENIFYSKPKRTSSNHLVTFFFKLADKYLNKIDRKKNPYLNKIKPVNVIVS